jgi:hypothetical protein
MDGRSVIYRAICEIQPWLLHSCAGYGSIQSQFAIAKTKDTEKEWIGTVGRDPSASLLIESISGNVKIDKR